MEAGATRLGRKIIEVEKKKLQELLSLAILSPTKENVARYLQAKKLWSEQSALFAEACGEAMIPKDLLAGLSERYFLLFFHRGEEDRAAAETARAFAKNHQWKLQAISLNGEAVEGLDSIADAGISSRFKVEAPPAFFLVEPASNRADFLGKGAISLNELETRVAQQIERGNP